MTEHRYQHSLRVASASKQLAAAYDQDENQLYLAGLLHDAAKDLSVTHPYIKFSDEQVALYDDYPAVWHALVLKPVLDFYFSDLIENTADIADIAMWHTTGRATLTVPQQILFVADFIEPGRTVACRSRIEHVAYDSLEQAVFEIAVFKIQSLVTKKVPICPFLLDCYNGYV